MGLEQTKRFETFPAKLSKQYNENQRKEKSVKGRKKILRLTKQYTRIKTKEAVYKKSK